MTDAAELYANALVWDNHVCPPLERAEAFIPRIERWRRSGVDVLALNVADSDVGLDSLVRQAARVRWFVAAHPEDYLMVRDASDIRRAKREGRTAVLLDVEGCVAIGDQLSLVSFLFDIGVRWMAMVYNRRNLVGSGVHDETDEGLSAFGREVVAEMDRVGLIKCCSHTGYRTAREVLEASTRPTIFSHSNPRALRDHPRNIPDDLIRACAATGGVVGLNGVGIFLGDNDIRTETLVRHMDYVANLVGPEHVGVALDAVLDPDGMDEALSSSAHIWPPQYGYRPGLAFYQPEQLPALADALVAGGWSEAAIRGVLGENLLRVADEVWPKAG